MSTVRWHDPKWNEKQKADFDRDLAMARPVLDRLAVILAKDMEASQRKQLDEGNFSKPAWSEYQAYLLGGQKELLRVLKIIE